MKKYIKIFSACLLVLHILLLTACSQSTKVTKLLEEKNYEQAVVQYNNMEDIDEDLQAIFVSKLKAIYNDYKNNNIDYDTAVSQIKIISKAENIDIANACDIMLARIEKLRSFNTPTTNTPTEPEPTTEPEPILSDKCDMILCTGYDGDDCYELVANERENYKGVVVKVGIIKNNK